MPPGEGEWGEEGMGKKGLHWKRRGEESGGVLMRFYFPRIYQTLNK